ncbi:MAG: response regulator transcription factor [Gemmatimonadetes bacterium]|nr:response regulator transcription factor [Gemmatimonadota bacterium]
MSVEDRGKSKRHYRILVVEDDPAIAALVAYQLTKEGFRVETAVDGGQAISSCNRAPPDLVVLDRMLPKIGGDEVLRQLRSEARSIPVLMLTARREQEDRVEGLEMGADDYLTKPFSPRELVLRVRAILRRVSESGRGACGPVLRAGGIVLDLGSFDTDVDGEPIALTPTEFRLLQALMERPGHTQSRRLLLEKAWGYSSEISFRMQTRTVDMHVRRLRTKLGPAGEQIQTVRGFGYRFGSSVAHGSRR